MITQERLKELFSYDPDTGLFTRLIHASANARAGDIAGNKGLAGYLRIRIDNKYYYNQRLAWLYVHGFMPNDQIDHINGIRDCNKISNLREATNKENAQNLTSHTKTPSGLRGAYWHVKTKKWQAKIKRGKKNKSLGYYHTAEEAHEAYLAYRRENCSFQQELRD
jgi:hypothetical protein